MEESSVNISEPWQLKEPPYSDEVYLWTLLLRGTQATAGEAGFSFISCWKETSNRQLGNTGSWTVNFCCNSEGFMFLNVAGTLCSHLPFSYKEAGFSYHILRLADPSLGMSSAFSYQVLRLVDPGLVKETNSSIQWLAIFFAVQTSLGSTGDILTFAAESN